jgi:citrate synthase
MEELRMATQETTKTVGTTGLAGIVVSDSSISYVDGGAGILEYRGYDIRLLAEQSCFDEVTFLLWNGRLPAGGELQESQAYAGQCRQLPPEILATIRSVPKSAGPMAVMRTMVSHLGLYDPDSEDSSPAAFLRKAYRLLGQIATVLAAFERIRQGKQPIEPRSDLDHATNFLWMLSGEEPEPLAARALDQYLLLLAEHELNASTFAARVTTSTQADLHSAITSALGTLKGQLHGRAVQEAMVQFMEIGSVEAVEPWFRSTRAQGRKVMGMGHRVYKVRDPRAAPLMRNLDLMVAATGEREWYDIARTLEETAMRDPYFRDRNLSANVDFYSAPLLYSLGIPVDAFTCMFAMSRIVGWAAHVWEQQGNNKLIRPLANYTGEHQRPWPTLHERDEFEPSSASFEWPAISVSDPAMAMTRND